MRPEVEWEARDNPRPSMWAYLTGRAFGRFVLFPLLFDMHVRGLKHVPTDGPLILASNHVSNFDPILVGTYVPRTTTFVAKQELYRVAPLALLWHWWGAVLVRRDGLDMRPLRILLRILAEGGTVGMFPEGTRSRGKGLQRPLPGAAYLAVKSGVPILPVAVWGADNLNLKRRMVRGRPRVDIRVGPVMVPEVPAGRITREVLDQVGEDVMHSIAALLPERLRGVYAESTKGADDA